MDWIDFLGIDNQFAYAIAKLAEIAFVLACIVGIVVYQTRDTNKK